MTWVVLDGVMRKKSSYSHMLVILGERVWEGGRLGGRERERERGREREGGRLGGRGGEREK